MPGPMLKKEIAARHTPAALLEETIALVLRPCSAVLSAGLVLEETDAKASNRARIASVYRGRVCFTINVSEQPADLAVVDIT